MKSVFSEPFCQPQECEGEISVVVGDKRSILVMNGRCLRGGMDISTATISPRHLPTVQGVGTLK